MNLQRIEELIEKYERGETTAEEEQLLKSFLLNEEVPPHLRNYKALFAYFESSKNEELPSIDFDDKVLAAIQDEKIIPMAYGNRKRLYFIISVAAGLLILFGLYFRYGLNGTSPDDTFNDPMLAYAETKKILLKVSANMNAGVNEMKSIKEFNAGLSELEKVSAFQTGLNQLEKVTIFEKAQEIITTKNK
jgi:hypothetical protein